MFSCSSSDDSLLIQWPDRAKPQLPEHTIVREKDTTPFQHARAILHVGATPDSLPCRDEEFTEIEAYLEDAIDEGTGSCICQSHSLTRCNYFRPFPFRSDIAGVPGTGKTATVRSVIQALQQRVAEGVRCSPSSVLTRQPNSFTQELRSFNFIELNGMKMTEPNQAFAMLWEFIAGEKATARQALSLLEEHFKTPTPGRETW